MIPLTIDLNADLGESPQRLADGSDAELMQYITSANVACGGHAGDAITIQQILELAKHNKVAVGAHPSYPDRANFGRTELQIPIRKLQDSIAEQIQELLTIAHFVGVLVVHVKPHGALYHACNRNPETARALARAVVALNPSSIVIGQAGSACLEIYRELGLRTAAEAFADRAYEPDGTLRNRNLPGALLDSPDRASSQALSIATQSRVTTISGSELEIAADTLCIHSDTPGSAKIAHAIRERLTSSGVSIQPLRS